MYRPASYGLPRQRVPIYTACMLQLSTLNGELQLFHTIQGEGLSAGKPSLFIRSALCNLACTWCDTAYTWDWSRFDKSQCVRRVDTEDLLPLVREYACRHLVLTGGEPLLQQSGWVELLTALNAQSTYTVEIETNGTLIPTPEFDQFVQQYNVSPKLENSGNERSRRRMDDVIGYFQASPKAVFKFVMANQDDGDEILDWVSTYALSKDRVFVMPEGDTVAQLDRHAEAVTTFCTAHGFRFSDRLHIRLNVK